MMLIFQREQGWEQVPQGKKNKLIQFISVEHLPSDLSVLCDEKGVSGMVPMSRMLDAARRANEEALANEGRMSCHISIKELTPFHIGALMYFFFSYHCL